MNEDFRKFNQEMMQNNPQDGTTAPVEDNTKAEPQQTTSEPKIKTSDNGTYHGFFLAPVNHLQRITDALNRMAETDEELSKAIAEGKKTFEGCDRYIRNNMADLAREMGQREITFDDDTVHFIARYYMVNPDNLDVQNVAKAVKESKKEPKPKAEKKTKVIPITPQMGNLFGDDDFQ